MKSSIPKQKRDYRAEYERRIQRGIAKGLSRSQARGHPKAKEKNVCRLEAPGQEQAPCPEGPQE